jgi:hypothetical protein
MDYMEGPLFMDSTNFMKQLSDRKEKRINVYRRNKIIYSGNKKFSGHEKKP